MTILNSLHRGRLFILIGAFMIMAAAFLPWIAASVLFEDAPGVEEGIAIGWEGDGYLTGAVGLILLVGSLSSKGSPGKRYSLAGSILGFLVCLVILSDVLAIVRIAPEAGVLASTGVGLYLTFIGGVLAIIGGLHFTPMDMALAPS